jgi:hypothetical protein
MQPPAISQGCIDAASVIEPEAGVVPVVVLSR